jgi:hypothetical protein
MTAQPMDFDDAWGYFETGYETLTPEQWAARGWDMARILDTLRAWDGTPHELSGPDMMNVANVIAAGLEERGLPMRPARDVDSLTLTTAHAASSYGRPVLVIDGEAYGPADMTPAGMTAAALLGIWFADFVGEIGK